VIWVAKKPAQNAGEPFKPMLCVEWSGWSGFSGPNRYICILQKRQYLVAFVGSNISVMAI